MDDTKEATYSQSVLVEKIRQLRRCGSIDVQIVSGSMEPVIKTGELVTVERLEGRPKMFDILVFHQNDKFICHYFWKENSHFDNEGKNYVTRPLSSRGFDIPFSHRQVLGRVGGKRIGFWRRAVIVVKEILRRR